MKEGFSHRTYLWLNKLRERVNNLINEFLRMVEQEPREMLKTQRLLRGYGEL